MDDKATSPLKAKNGFLFEKINCHINTGMTSSEDWELAYELLLLGKVCVRLSK